MEKYIIALFELRDLAQVFHWQTMSFAQHKASDNLLKNILPFTDRLVESHMGRFGRINFNVSSITIKNVDKNILENKIKTLVTLFEEVTFPDDTENIKCEIMSLLNQTLYLLSLN
jgi:hypothetical protein